MMEFQCSCGKELRAHSRLAGKRSRCPSCRRIVRIPGGPEAPEPLPSAADPFDDDPSDSSNGVRLPTSLDAGTPQPTAASQATPPPMPQAPPVSVREQYNRLIQTQAARQFPVVELICGGLMLLTFLLPWWTAEELVGCRVTVMSWNMVDSVPASLAVLMIILWVIGLAAIVTACVLRGLPAALAHGSMGTAGALLLCIISLVLYSDMALVAGPPSSVAILGMISLMIIMVQVVATNVRLKCGASMILRAVQGMTSGLVIILTVVGLVMMLVEFGSLSKFARSGMWPDILFRCVFDAVVIAAMILILVHAAAMTIRTKTLSQTGLCLIYGVLTAMALYLIIRPAALMEEASLALLFTNILLLFAPPFVLACLGATKAISLHLGPAEQGK